MIRSIHARITAPLAAAGALWLAVAAAAPSPMTRDEIIDLSKPAMGFSYWWGHGRFSTGAASAGSCSGSCPNCTHSGQYGGDCSGLTAKVWQIPSPIALEQDAHPYSTNNFRNATTHWTQISRADVKKGDAFVYNTNGAGHIFMYESGDPWGSLWSYECKGCSAGCLHDLRTAGSAYIAIRRNAINEGPPPEPPKKTPKGKIELANCANITGWAQDPNDPQKSIDVVVYVGGHAGVASATGLSAQADVNRSDLCGALGSCDHGFSIPTPLGFKDGSPYAVYAYAVDASSGTLTLLDGSPLQISCILPAPPMPAIRRKVLDQTSLGAWQFTALSNVQHLTDGDVSQYPDGPDLPAQPLVVQADDGTQDVWVIDGPTRRHVPPNALSAWQFDAGETIQTWPSAQLYATPQGVDLRVTPVLVRGSGSDIWLLDDPNPYEGPGGESGAAGAGGSDNTVGSSGAGGSGQGEAGAGGTGGSASAGASGSGGAGTAGSASQGAAGKTVAVIDESAGDQTESGCGCRVVPSGNSGALWALALALLPMTRAARRRRR